MNNNHFRQRIINKAIKLKNLPVCGKHKHLSFIVRKNKILSIGFNSSGKTHPLADKFDYAFQRVHSELSCIVRFPFPHHVLHECFLVNVRITKKNEFRLSKPCKNCIKLLSAFGLKEVWYSDKNGQFSRMTA